MWERKVFLDYFETSQREQRRKFNFLNVLEELNESEKLLEEMSDGKTRSTLVPFGNNLAFIGAEIKPDTKYYAYLGAGYFVKCNKKRAQEILKMRKEAVRKNVNNCNKRIESVYEGAGYAVAPKEDCISGKYKEVEKSEEDVLTIDYPLPHPGSVSMKNIFELQASVKKLKKKIMGIGSTQPSSRPRKYFSKKRKKGKKKKKKRRR